MASASLYPPTIDSSLPAFITTNRVGTCRIYFSLSNFSSSSSTIKSIHISVVKQSNGQNVVNRTDQEVDTTDDQGNAKKKYRYRKSGIIILNLEDWDLYNVSDNYYYIELSNTDVKAGDYVGWQAGWIYKVQIRLSTVAYTDSTIGITQWLTAEASNFSEWSTCCLIKATGWPKVQVPLFTSEDSSSSSNVDEEISLAISTLDFSGTYTNTDESETLYSYNLTLYDEDWTKLEESGDIFANQYYNPNKMSYTLKTTFENSKTYRLKVMCTTINKYSMANIYKLTIDQDNADKTSISAMTLDNVDNLSDKTYISDFKNITSLAQEEEEGRIGIKLYSNTSVPYNGNICIKRASSVDNYATWTDIKIITCVNTIINSLDIVYDNTVESNVWYKYAIQNIDTDGSRSIMNPQDSSSITPSIRDFEYSYLIGENGKQLSLKYNSSMSSYLYNYSESKTDTIGGQFPIITRNGNMKYRSFPVNGLISFNMDENKLFTSDKEIYCDSEGNPYTNVINSYSNRRSTKGLDKYDFKRELDFRQKVMDFLQDGKPKLFKSASEGNIIVRLMNVSWQPEQSISRLISSFSATAYEIAEATVENYAKYNFLDIGTYSESFETYISKVGQLDMDFTVGDNIIKKIWEKYDRSTENIAGVCQTLKTVHHLSIEFTDAPLRVATNSGEIVIGNNFQYGSDAKITVRADYGRIYVFDDDIEFTGQISSSGSFLGDSLTILGGLDNVYDSAGNITNTTVHAEVNFVYEISEKAYTEKKVTKRAIEKRLGQIYGLRDGDSDLFEEVATKYYWDQDTKCRKLDHMTWTCIEATPGAVFKIIDETDNTSTEDATVLYHDINETGVLNLEGLGAIDGLVYLGMREEDGSIDSTAICDMLIDYIAYVVTETYKES